MGFRRALADRALLVIALSSAASVAGCVSTVSLVPLVPLERGVAVVEKSGIVLRAEVKPGLHHVPEGVTAIRISVKNAAEIGVYVDPADIELESDARSFEAMPVTSIEPRLPVGLGLDPMLAPYGSAQGAASLYMGAPGYYYGGGFSVDPAHPYTSGGGWLAPSSREILLTAFEGGYIDIGERRQGIVYFPTPPKDIGKVTLRVRVHAGIGSAPVETFEVPYSVQEG